MNARPSGLHCDHVRKADNGRYVMPFGQTIRLFAEGVEEYETMDMVTKPRITIPCLCKAHAKYL